MIKSFQGGNAREAFAKADKDWCHTRKSYLLLYSPLILCCDVSKFHPIMMGQITARDTEAARWGMYLFEPEVPTGGQLTILAR